MSQNSQPYRLKSKHFQYLGLQNDISQDQIPYSNQQIPISKISNDNRNFSNHNHLDFSNYLCEDSTQNSHKNSHKLQQTCEIHKKIAQENLKPNHLPHSQEISFVILLLLGIFVLVLIGGISFAQFQQNFREKPETDVLRRDQKKLLYKIYKESKINQGQKNLKNEAQNNALHSIVPSTTNFVSNDIKEPRKEQTKMDSNNISQILSKNHTQIQEQRQKIQNQKIHQQKQITHKLIKDHSEQIIFNSVQKKPYNAKPSSANLSEARTQKIQSIEQTKKEVKKQITQSNLNQIPLSNIEIIQINNPEKIGEPLQIADTRNWKKPKHQDQSNILKKPVPQLIDEATKTLNCLDFIRNEQGTYGKLYTFTPKRQYFRSNSGADYYSQNDAIKITNQKYTEAVDLLDITHKIDYYGNIAVSDTPCETKDQAAKRTQQNILKQTKRLNQVYQIDFYHKKQLRFCIVTNSYNNAHNGLIYRNIDSILQQNYSNYHVVYTDDASPDDTGPIVRNYLSEKGVEGGKFKVKINSAKKGMMENIFNSITQDCQLGEIAVMLDGDDSFIGTNVLSLLNGVYQKEKIALMWNNFLEITENKLAYTGFSRAIDDFKRYEGYFREKTLLSSSHLKSFYVDLFVKIKVSDLQEESGVFYGGASDTAIMIPMLEMSFPRFMYVPEILYEYRIDTGHLGMIENREAQVRALIKISNSSSYLQLSDFSFIDHSIEKAELLSRNQNKQ